MTSRKALASFFLIFLATLSRATAIEPGEVRIPLGESGDLDAADLVNRLANHAGLNFPKPEIPFPLPTNGVGGTLTRTLLTESIGPDVTLRFEPNALIAQIRPDALSPEGLPAFRDRLDDLATRAAAASQRRANYGLTARPSYRPNDPNRPTLCLVHGLNSSSAVFRHLLEPLETAGFGLVLYDYPYNRDLDQTAPAFSHDWSEFRLRAADTRPWSILSHSMGALLARSYVEGDTYTADVADLLLVAPPNHGSNLAGAQSLLQLIQGMRAARGREARALAALSDGVGAAAEDLSPGSPFLDALNARPRRPGVRYHILAGNQAILTQSARQRLEFQLRALGGAGGFLGHTARLAATDLAPRLDELTDGLGDGCVSVASTRLEGVTDHLILPTDHLEIIRSPRLYPDPGPVPCLPAILERLGVKSAAPSPR